MKRFWKPLFALLVLAPFSGELLSGSAPPREMINPFTFGLLVMLYGSGAVLIREFVRRWGKGWPSILLLGLAYGIYEEGIVVRSFFDPTWQDLGQLGEYGRWLGVNWVWTADLTLFHAVVSIAIPILLVELAFPEQRHRLWVTRRGLKIHGLLFGSMALIGTGFGKHAPPLGYVGCALVIAVLIGLARRWPDRDPATVQHREPPRQWRIGLLGFLGMVGFLITMWIIPENEPPALISFLACLALPVLVYWRAARLGIRSWGPRQQWALAAGALSFWIGLAFMLVAGPDMPIAGALFVWILWRVGRCVRQVDVLPPTDAQVYLTPRPPLHTRRGGVR